MCDELAPLLIDLSGLDDNEAELATLDKYAALYLDKGRAPKRLGVRTTHDGEEVLFYEDRFPHAFSATVSWCTKGAFDRTRGERVAWIGPVIAGEIDGTECWTVPPKNGGRRGPRRRPDRLYVVSSTGYVVWLSPRDEGGWKFSSAYVAGHGDIRRYHSYGRRIWARKKTP